MKRIVLCSFLFIMIIVFCITLFVFRSKSITKNSSQQWSRIHMQDEYLDRWRAGKLIVNRPDGFVDNPMVAKELAIIYMRAIHFKNNKNIPKYTLKATLTEDVWSISFRDKSIVRLKKSDGSVLEIITHDQHFNCFDTSVNDLIDEVVVKQIAKVIFVNIWGQNIKSYQPFDVNLVSFNDKETSAWYIVGRLPEDRLGGVPYLKIRSNDGAILGYTHTK